MTETPGTGPAAPQIVRHRLLQIEDFLPTAEVAALIERTFASEKRYNPSSTSDQATNYRQSFAMDAPPEFAGAFTGRIRALIPDIVQALRMRPFTCGLVECQLTANTDGSYFRTHTDAGTNDTILRQLTYVYYYNRDPKGFDGGELRIYDDQIRNGKLARVDSFQTVEPRHNSIVFFQAAIMHEVTPVRVASGEFRDSRFTVNGWVWRK